MNQKKPTREMRDTRHDAIPLMIRQQKTNPKTTHTNSTPQMLNPATIDTITTVALKLDHIMPNGEVLVDSCFAFVALLGDPKESRLAWPCSCLQRCRLLPIFPIVFITSDFFLCLNGAGMVSSVSEAIKGQAVAHSKISAKKTYKRQRRMPRIGERNADGFRKTLPRRVWRFFAEAPTGATSCLGVTDVNTFASENGYSTITHRLSRT
jgi:hypothetical protein